MIFIILYYFIFGVIFISFAYPILSGLADLALTYIEFLKGILTLKITKYNERLNEMGQETRVIGFSVDTDDEEEVYEENE